MRRPTPSMVISCTALFVALGGTGIAAQTLITSSNQIKNGVITSGDIRNGTIAAADIKNGSISTAKLATAVRGASAAGGGSAFEAVRRNGPELAQAGGATVATLRGLAPGTYAIFAKTTLSPNKPEQGLGELLRSDRSGTGHCVLNAAGDVDDARESLTQPGAQQPSTLNLQLTRSFGEAGDVSLVCDSNQPFRASDTSIIALRLSSSDRKDVTE